MVALSHMPLLRGTLKHVVKRQRNISVIDETARARIFPVAESVPLKFGENCINDQRY